MSTGQKYSGKGETTTQPDTNGSNPEQMGEISPQTAKPTLSANVFTFDELVLFDGLSDSGKTIIAALVNSGNYQPEQLSRALQHIAQTPDISSETDESLQSVLTSQDDVAPLTLKDLRGEKIERLTVNVPSFLCWQVQDFERTKSLLSAISRVFCEFSRSKDGTKIEENVDQMLAYGALKFGFLEIVEKAAKQLGTYEKPKPSEYLFDIPQLATNDPEIDKEPFLIDDSRSCTDVDELHDWISALQQMTLFQAKIASNLEKIDINNTKIIENQGLIIAELQEQIKRKDQIVESYQVKSTQRNVPDAHPYIDLTLYLYRGIESEVELVRQALQDASKAKLKQSLKHIVVDETEDAFFLHEEHEKLQDILGRLAMQAIEVASDNFSSSHYKDHPQGYLLSEKSDHKRLMTRKGAFIDEFSVFTEQDQEAPTPLSELPTPVDPTPLS